jgi:inner membrane protein
MEPLTHTFVGAALSETGLGSRTRFATAALLVGVNLPDIDGLAYFWGGDVALGFRRGWTHGLLLVALYPFLLSAILVGIDRLRPRGPVRASFLTLTALSAVAVVTHPFLDWLNTYGIRFLMPFDDRWYYGDGLFVIDPYGWLMLGGAVFLARPRMETWERIVWGVLALMMSLLILGTGFAPVPARAIWIAGLAVLLVGRLSLSRSRRPRLAVAGLVLMTTYILMMLTASSIVSSTTARSLAADGTGVEDVMASPLPANPLAWDVVARTPNGFRFGTWHWFEKGSPVFSTRLIRHPPADPRVEAARAAPHVRGAMIWMRYPYVEIEPTPHGSTVWIIDARYQRLDRGGFGSAVVRLDHEFQPLEGK